VTLTVPTMTRFLLSLDEAVDTIFAALREAKRGETYGPRAPAARVGDIARALIGKQRIATKVFGIRPGEKMHEILISEEEVNHCVRRGRYYAILSMLPELRRGGRAEKNALKKEFSSADTVLSLQATAALLRRNRLMPEDQPRLVEGELLR
jgi:UDP-glucose 4-epimerase